VVLFPTGYFCGVQVMKTVKAVSEESLQRLWSEIALLRQEIEQAERSQEASQLRLTAAISVAQDRH
jgi:hypothetical protein